MKPDRRSGIDRRGTRRYGLLLDIEFEDSGGRRTGTLSDIGLNGCFVLAKSDTRDGENVKIFLPLSAGMAVQFEGVVSNHVPEIGFAVNFVDLTPAQLDFLDNFIEVYKGSAPGLRT